MSRNSTQTRLISNFINYINSFLDDFAKLYDVIKNEKNKYVHMIQTSTQKAAELRDK